MTGQPLASGCRIGKVIVMTPALWQAVIARLKIIYPSARLTAVDDFNARIKVKDSKAKLRAFYQPREGDVPGEAKVWLSFNGQTELGAISSFVIEQERYAKSFKFPLHFNQKISKRLPDGLGEATLTFKAGVVSWHNDELIQRIASFYAESIGTLLNLHAELTLKDNS